MWYIDLKLEDGKHLLVNASKYAGMNVKDSRVKGIAVNSITVKGININGKKSLTCCLTRTRGDRGGFLASACIQK